MPVPAGVSRVDVQTAPAPGTTPTPQPTAEVKPLLPAPVGLQAEAAGDRIILAWEPAPAAVATPVTYRIYRSETAFSDPPPSENLINRSAVSEPYFLDSRDTSIAPPMAGKNYYYAVVVMDGQGNLSAMSALLAVANLAQLTPPSSFEARPQDQKVELTWVPSFSGGPYGLAGYVLYRSEAQGQEGELLTPKPLEQSSYIDQPLVNGQTYYYSLYAQDRRGNRSAPLETLSAVPFVSAGAPQNLTATGKTDDAIEVSWSAAQAGTFPLAGYNVYRSSDAEAQPVKVNRNLLTSPLFSDDEQNSVNKPLLGRFYTYTVRAVDVEGFEGPASASAQAGPRPPLEIPSTGLLSTSIPGLPPESSLTISGRKKIDVSYTEVTPLNVQEGGSTDRYPSLTSGLTKGFNLDQELQVRLEGKVGKKITVDVDYDDTLEEQRKISIIYAGDPDEVIQEAAFGDILLDLPRTEFAGYNKNLFGAKLKVAFNNFRFHAIGAQTKGITVTEKFKGNTSPRTLDKQDVYFTAFKYYYLTKAWPSQVNHPELPIYDGNQVRHGIVPGSDKIYVTNGLVTAQSVTVTANGQEVRFNLLSPGVDYTLDYERGIITFTNTMAQTWLIAVAYKYTDENGVVHTVGYSDPAGTVFDFNPANLFVPGDPAAPVPVPAGQTSDTSHLIQNYNSLTNARDYRMMLMNRYALGYQNILDPQSDADFKLKVFANDGSEVQLPQPSDTLNAEHYYRIDPTFGTIQFIHDYPLQQRLTNGEPAQFLSDDYQPNRNDAYNTQYNPTLTSNGDINQAHKFTLHIEFKNVISTFQLQHYNIIPNSEIIRKDGLKLQRNTDYYLDNDSGYLTFLNPENIASSTEITVTYEYLPFGGKFQSSIFGARGEYDIIPKKLSVGSTFLYNASQAPLEIPDIRSTPNSLSLFDGDIKLSLNPDDFGEAALPWVGNFKVPLTVDVAAEGAYSIYNSNTYRRAGEDSVAMIDSMEGSDNVLALPVNENANNIWFPSSSPGTFTDPAFRRYVYLTDVFETGRVPVDSNDKVHQMRWNYSDMSNATWDGFVYPISSSGANLHEYRYLEISYYSAADSAHPIRLNIDLGIISEDSNGNYRLNFEGDRQIFAQGVDKGIGNYMSNPYAVPPTIAADPSGPTGIYPTTAQAGFSGPGVPQYWGASNDKLDNEDLDNDDQIDLAQSYYEYEITLQPGWNMIKIPLATPTRLLGDTLPTANSQDPTFLGFVKHARLWITAESGSASSGYFQIESIQLTGNKWQPRVAPNTVDVNGVPVSEASGGTLNATAISRETYSGYQPDVHFFIYDEDYKERDLQNERALELEYTLDQYAVVNYNAGNTMPAYYLTRTLSNDTTGYDYSFYRYLRVDVFKKTSTAPGERLFVRLGLDQNNFYQYELPLDEARIGTWHTYTVELDGSDGRRLAVFQPNIIAGLNQVKEISLGVINPNPTAVPEILWINSLRATDAKTREGMAARITSSTRLSDIFSVNTDHRDIGTDFFQIDETPSGKQHVTQERVDGSITKLSYLPVNVNWTRTENYTELQNRSLPTYSNNFSVPDVVNETIGGDVAYNQLTGLDLSVSAKRTRKNTSYIEQRYNVNYDEETTETTPTMSYTLPSQILNLPIGTTTFTGKFRYVDNHIMYNPEGIRELKRTDLWDKWKHTKEETYSYQGSYSPLSFLRFNPSFTYSQNSDRGFLTAYKFYSELTNTVNAHYFSDLYRTSRLEKVAKLNLNLVSLPVVTPSLTYAMTNSRDYINDTLAVPGSLSLQSSVALGEIFGWREIPRINWSRNYNISATYRTEVGLDPISQLEFDHLWVIDPFGFREKDNLFDDAYINSKNERETWGTSFNVLSNVTLNPDYSTNWKRDMNTRNNFITTETMTAGSGLTWNQPFSLPGVVLQSLSLDYHYSETNTLDRDSKVTNRTLSHTSSATLPFRILNDLSSTLNFNSTNSERLYGENLEIKVMDNLYSGGLSLAYNLNLNTPIKLPDFWPFNGTILKIQQSFRLLNSFKIEMARISEVKQTGSSKNTDMYTNETSLNYSLWRNVEGEVSVTNQWYYDHLLANKDYWAIKIKAGLTAIF
ncbi:MAG: hypothetical protein AB1439_03570 [candidate division FCPU426 bacterium]